MGNRRAVRCFGAAATMLTHDAEAALVWMGVTASCCPDPGIKPVPTSQPIAEEEGGLDAAVGRASSFGDMCGSEADLSRWRPESLARRC